MKKTAIISISILIIIFSGCAGLMTVVPGNIPLINGLTKNEVIMGLKEALTVSATNSIALATSTVGFYNNPAIRIPFPEEAIAVKNALEKAGKADIVATFEKSLNKAAEEASKQALPILKDAINTMPITDALNILQGPDNAATLLLKTKTESNMKTQFNPIIKVAMQTTGVTACWAPVATAYNGIAAATGAKQVNPNLPEYIAQKSIDGIFTLMGQEEQKIRNNPEARVTDNLKKVFGTN